MVVGHRERGGVVEAISSKTRKHKRCREREKGGRGGKRKGGRERASERASKRASEREYVRLFPARRENTSASLQRVCACVRVRVWVSCAWVCGGA